MRNKVIYVFNLVRWFGYRVLRMHLGLGFVEISLGFKDSELDLFID